MFDDTSCIETCLPPALVASLGQFILGLNQMLEQICIMVGSAIALLAFATGCIYMARLKSFDCIVLVASAPN